MDQSAPSTNSKAVDAAVAEAIQSTSTFYQVLMDREAFDKEYIRGVMTNLVLPTERDNCFLVCYHRVNLNIRSIITLNNVQHSQAVAMLTRSIFELAIDIRLINVIPDSVAKMYAFNRLERLRAAVRSTNFADTHEVQFPTNLLPLRALIALQGDSILLRAAELWGKGSRANITLNDFRRITHWSGMGLLERAKRIGKPFEEIYESLYKQISWQVHSGLEGVLDKSPEWFPQLYGISCQIAALSYGEVLTAVIIEYRISCVLPTIYKELEFAKLRAWFADPSQEQALRKNLGLP